jgi:hypothetical protein
LSTEMRLGPESLSLRKIGRLGTFVATLPMSGGQGVASSNLASPTVKHLVRVHFPGRGMYRQAVKGHRFQFISDGPG